MHKSDLERMYHEIIKTIDPEKLSYYSKGTLESSSSFSSSSNSARRSNPRKLTGIRSSSQRDQRNDNIRYWHFFFRFFHVKHLEI